MKALRKFIPLIGLLMTALLLSGMAVSAQDIRSDNQPPERVRPGGVRLVHVTDVQILNNASTTDRIAIRVQGFQRGCDVPVRVQQWGRGRLVNVVIGQYIPDGMVCPEVIKPYEAVIPLEFDYDPAVTYLLRVNNVFKLINPPSNTDITK